MTPREDMKARLSSFVDPPLVRVLVAEIQAVCGDDEVAHSRSDDLHLGVLCAIAEGRCQDVAGCAAAALLTEGLDFERWCA